MSGQETGLHTDQDLHKTLERLKYDYKRNSDRV